jgi:hypothetical protein
MRCRMHGGKGSGAPLGNLNHLGRNASAAEREVTLRLRRYKAEAYVRVTEIAARSCGMTVEQIEQWRAEHGQLRRGDVGRQIKKTLGEAHAAGLRTRKRKRHAKSFSPEQPRQHFRIDWSKHRS